VVAEFFGRTGLEGDLDESARGRRRRLVLATKAVAVVVGGSTGVVRASADLRVRLGGLGPRHRDTDGGIANNRDRCPVAAEDHDSGRTATAAPTTTTTAIARRRPTSARPRPGFDGLRTTTAALSSTTTPTASLISTTCLLDAEDKPPFIRRLPVRARHRRRRHHGSLDECSDAEDDASRTGACPDFDRDKDDVADDEDQCPVCAEDRRRLRRRRRLPRGRQRQRRALDAADTCRTRRKSSTASTTDGSP
jgi:hypothetical protein